ncbi:hypothetical protein GCM10027037_24010 [Mucilaginibacter koreensis]
MAIENFFKKIKSKAPSFLIADDGLSYMERYRLRKLSRFTPADIIFFEKKFKIGDVLTFRSSYYEIFKQQIYHFKNSNPDEVIIDCGANIGLATIYLKMTHPKAQVIAFEPDPAIFSILQYNIESFGLKDVLLRNEAVSTADKHVSFISDGGHSGKIIQEALQNRIEVKAVRLKTVLAGYECITFLKIDIEGEEVKVIPDIADQLTKVEYMFLEYHSYLNQTQELDTLLTIIRNAGMRYYIQEAVQKKHPFLNNEIFLGMDLLVNIFCYR